MNISTNLLLLTDFCCLAILILWCVIRVKKQVRQSNRESTKLLAEFFANQIKTQGALLMSTVSSGVANVQSAIEEVKAEVVILKDTQVKTSASITAEIQRVEAVIVGLQGAPGDPAALQAAVADLGTVKANLEDINSGLQGGTAALDSEQAAPPTPTPIEAPQS